MHLRFAWRSQKKPGEVQRELRIFKEGKIVISAESALSWLMPVMQHCERTCMQHQQRPSCCSTMQELLNAWPSNT